MAAGACLALLGAGRVSGRALLQGGIDPLSLPGPALAPAAATLPLPQRLWPATLTPEALAPAPGLSPQALPPGLVAVMDEAVALAGAPAPERGVADALTLDVRGGDDSKAVLRFLGNTGNVPKLALDSDNKVLYVYATQNSTGAYLSTTNPDLGADEVSPVTLSSFTHNVVQMASQQGAVGTQLISLAEPFDGLAANHPYAFLGVYRDTREEATSALLANAKGDTLVVPSSDLWLSFGSDVYRLLWSAASGDPYVPSNAFPPSVSPSGQTLDISTASPGQVQGWLAQRTSPALAYSNIGRAFFVADAGHQQVNLTSLMWGEPYRTISLQRFVKEFNFADSATLGRGTPVVAEQDSDVVTGGSTYTLQQLRSRDAQVFVDLDDPRNASLSLSLHDFRDAFGDDGIVDLQASVLTDPEMTPGMDGATYASPPDGAILFPDDPGPWLVAQGVPGDCYFLAALIAQLNANPSWVVGMIGESADGNPHHYDARYYLPVGNQTELRTFTFNDRLPHFHNGSHAAAEVLVDVFGRPLIGVPLLEKGFVIANEERRLHSPVDGYAGIEGGSPAQAMSMITGLFAEDLPLSIFTPGGLREVLHLADHPDTLVVLGTRESNVPGPFLDHYFGTIEEHTYPVLGALTNTTDNATIALLRNPWGMVVPDGKGGLDVQHAEFIATEDDILGAFDVVGLGEAR